MSPHIRTALTNSQLFFDDSWIASSAFVRRQWHTPLRHPHPIIQADRPWDNQCPVMFGSVKQFNGLFHAWYPVWTRDHSMRVCYAQSKDGIDWITPDLGLYDTLGARGTNVVLVSDSPEGIIDDLTVIDDPSDRQWPLKMLYWDRHGATQHDGTRATSEGYHLARSSDGITWEKCGQVLRNYGDRFNALPVKFKGKFRALVREPNMYDTYPQGRVASYIESNDLKTWSKPQLAMAADTEDPPYMEIYSVVPFVYEGLVLGGIERMHKSPDKLDTEIAWSRDGKIWSRSRTRQSFIPLSNPDRWDDRWINLSASQPIRVNNDLLFYYSGRHGAHQGHPLRCFGGIGVATLRVDGFCSMNATERPGSFTTPAFTWPGGELLINADCRRNLDSFPFLHSGGYVKVEVRDAGGKPIKGYEMATNKPFTLNTWNMPGCFAAVTWQSDRKLHKLTGRTVQLHFAMRDSHLFAFKAGQLA
jgi:hypothetical protein